MELVHKLDEFGKPAWIGLMVAGFVVFWPIGLAILGYMMWSGRMGCFKRSRGQWWKSESRASGSSGNAAFDDYKAETLRRLEEEQQEFKDFLEQLRRAKDKAEFDQFMSQRRSRPEGSAPDANPA